MKRDQSKHISYEDEADIDLLLIGGTGDGKSATGNSILRTVVFKSNFGAESVTSEVSSGESEYKGKKIKVVDCPGIGDTRLSPEKREQQINEWILKTVHTNPRGYHAFLLVSKFVNRFNDETKSIIETLKSIFGVDVVKNHCIVIFTFGDCFSTSVGQKKSFKKWLKEQKGGLRKLIDECGSRVVLFDNTAEEEEDQKRQLDELLDSIKRLKGVRYTDKNFKEGQAFQSKMLKKLECLEHELTNEKTNGKVTESGVEELKQMKDGCGALIGEIEFHEEGTNAMKNLKQKVLDVKQEIETELKAREQAYESILKTIHEKEVEIDRKISEVKTEIDTIGKDGHTITLSRLKELLIACDRLLQRAEDSDQGTGIMKDVMNEIESTRDKLDHKCNTHTEVVEESERKFKKRIEDISLQLGVEERLNEAPDESIRRLTDLLESCRDLEEEVKEIYMNTGSGKSHMENLQELKGKIRSASDIQACRQRQLKKVLDTLKEEVDKNLSSVEKSFGKLSTNRKASDFSISELRRLSLLCETLVRKFVDHDNGMGLLSETIKNGKNWEAKLKDEVANHETLLKDNKASHKNTYTDVGDKVDLIHHTFKGKKSIKEATEKNITDLKELLPKCNFQHDRLNELSRHDFDTSALDKKLSDLESQIKKTHEKRVAKRKEFASKVENTVKGVARKLNEQLAKDIPDTKVLESLSKQICKELKNISDFDTETEEFDLGISYMKFLKEIIERAVKDSEEGKKSKELVKVMSTRLEEYEAKEKKKVCNLIDTSLLKGKEYKRLPL